MSWNRRSNVWSQTGVYFQSNMERTRLSELHVCLGSHYAFIHQGDCNHVIVFTGLRAIHRSDPPNRFAYPWEIYKQNLKRQRCGVCDTYAARYVTYGDKYTTHDPFFWCETCYHPFHFDKKGNRLYDDFEVYAYFHD